MSIPKKRKKHKTPWWVIYNEIAQRLLDHYKFYNEQSGTELYYSCRNDSDFYESNEWLRKFERKFSVHYLDPIHIFASISGNRLSEQRRIEKINKLYDLLKISDAIFYDIDFSGCPTLAVTRILWSRSKNDQAQIWDFFVRIVERQEITDLDFIHLREWPNLDETSFTIFLFWICSDHFLPIERNTRNFLKQYRLEVPRDYESYQKLLNIIRRFNEPVDEGYGENGLFREIYLHAFNNLNSVKSFRKESWYYRSFIDTPNKEDLVEEVTRSAALDEALEAPQKEEKQEEAPRVFKEKRAQSEKSNIIADLGFKLVAIVPQKNCAFLKILKLEPFYFEKTFAITEEENVLYDATKQISLYNINVGVSDDLLKVNVTAIVGKNGSGKSSLVELFFRIINNITYQFQEELNTEKILPVKGIRAKLYYITDGRLFSIHINNTKNIIQEYSFHEAEAKFTKFDDERPLEFRDLESFFYTIAINYSHYALNSIEMPWVERLFLKNDGYQAPIVLNPMRDKGNIDINTEDKLVKSRLLVNLFSPIEEGDLGMRQLTEKQQAVAVHFKLNENKSKVWNEEKRMHLYIEATTLISHKDRILNAIYKKFEFPENYASTNTKIVVATENYILKKLVRIAETYSKYNDYLLEKEKEIIHSLNIETIERYIDDLYNDSSHITYKLKQAIYYLKYYDLVPKVEAFSLKLDDLTDNIQATVLSGRKEIDALPFIELLPPPIFDINIQLAENDNQDKLTDFKFLSSGEKQQIYAASSILYHFQNLNSINGSDLVNYTNLNFLLDEIELYYHPEMQRRYLAYLLKMLSRIGVKNINCVNICMVTHSPYILSDIPDNYLLKLQDGKISKEKDNKTFGANVHDLLANDFFMSSGFMGEFAKQKIGEVILFFNYIKLKKEYNATTDKEEKEKLSIKLCEVIKSYDSKFSEETLEEYLEDNKWLSKKADYKKIIDTIGEPIIKYKLDAMYSDFFEDIDFKRQQLEKLAKELNMEITPKE